MDIIIKSLIFSDSVNLCVIKSTDMVNRAIKLFNLSPVCAAALGRTLTAGALMALGLKDKNCSLTITVNGGGPIGKIIVSVDGDLNVRGYADNPDVYLPLNKSNKLDVSKAVGTLGKITVVKDLGLKQNYIGSSSLVNGEIAEDFVNYYAVSEQIPTALSLGVLIGKDGKCLSAGGLIFQPLPYCSEDVIIKLENLVKNFTDISKQLSDKSSEEFLKENFNECGLKILECRYPKYKCKCSIVKIKQVLKTIPKDDINKMLLEDGKIEVVCNFCNKKYLFTKEKLIGFTEKDG